MFLVQEYEQKASKKQSGHDAITCGVLQIKKFNLLIYGTKFVFYKKTTIFSVYGKRVACVIAKPNNFFICSPPQRLIG